MSEFIVNGGARLVGEITVGGSKNAALPIIFSTIITRGVSILYGVPDISDVSVALKLLQNMGALVLRDGEALYIDTTTLEYSVPDESLVSKIRASSYLIGATLSRFGRADICRFGGCNFDNRPIDMHLCAARALGAERLGSTLFARKLTGADIVFDKISVGATVNAIVLSVSATGVSRIFGYAREPHVYSLIEFLNTAGADIRCEDNYILIDGRALHGGRARIIPDMIEAGTYLLLSVMTGDSIKVSGIARHHLQALFDLLTDGGVSLYFDSDSVTAEGSLFKEISVVTSPYPGFPTDLQPQMAPLLATMRGGEIVETVWHSRFGYLTELSELGVKYTLSDSCAKIEPSELHSGIASATDLRGGAALLMAAIAAQGRSVIKNAEIINRGYENIVNKLRSVGADIVENN